jgi:hypothetical protein
VFPFWRGASTRLASRLDRWGSRLAFRIAIALVLASLHVVAFWQAGHDRLNLPFNSAPEHEPYFSDPDAPTLTAVPRQPHYWSRLVLSRFDAQHYIAMSVRGLTACPTDGAKATDMQYLQCGLGWLPAWGEVGGVFARVTTLPDDYALVVLSILLTILVNVLWTSTALVSRIGKLEAYGTLIAFNAFPPAFHMVTPYTEAITIACVLGGFLFITQQRWFLAALCVGASTAFRPHAVAYTLAFGVAALAAAWQRRRDGHKQWWRPLAACSLAGWGQLATMLCLKIFAGDWWAFFRARRVFGDAHAADRLIDGANYMASFGGQNMDGVMWFALVGIVLLVYRETLARFRLDEKAFLVAGGAITAAFSMVAPLLWWGISRYMMLFLIGFICAGKVLRRYPVLFWLWIVFCLAVYWNVELCNYLTQGDPRVCSCQGRLETYLPF